MKCPKCQYISFGSETRCRNCGYDFSLSDEVRPLDLPIRRGDEAIGPLADLPLDAPPAPAVPASRPAVRGASDPGSAGQPPLGSRLDLPLFAGREPDDAPLVNPAAVPRPPLAVRRGAPAPSRSRDRQRQSDNEPELDLPISESLGPESVPTRDIVAPLSSAEAASPTLSSAEARRASVVARLAAGSIDLLIIGLIDIAVLYLTLRVSGLQADDVLLLPIVPLGAFLLLLNGGYFTTFTAASGQTIGKMAAGIRVVTHAETGVTGRVSFGTAVVRAAAYVASILPVGLGFAPILFSADGRALHDRLSDTRVVKA